MKNVATIAVACLWVAASAQEQPQDQLKDLDLRTGLIENYLDAKTGKVYLKLPRAATGSDVLGEYLYTETLASGLGANQIGLDRGQTGTTYILRIRRIADKVLFEVPNYGYRASSDDPMEQRAAREAFATSIVWNTAVVRANPDGTIVIDASDFFLRDAHGVARALEQQGGYTLDKGSSVIDPAVTKSFPDNLEVEALLTFRSSRPSRLMQEHAPEAEFVTLRQRHSIVRLPDSKFQPRPYHPRAGSFEIRYLDFSSPLGETMVRQFIQRHRLEVVPGSPEGAREVVKPIVYYVERGVPEPIRTALIQGGNYWQKAFEATGYRNAFRVELMPEGMDAMDVRYNVIHWTNRSTRGWAYGMSVTDPRTGEIVRGVVNLDSQRARQDVLLFESLIGVGGTGKGGPNDPIEVAVSRIRQLSAHEIGHTLGFQHNFAASVNNRASVMDYPAPLITITTAGQLDLSQAYAQGVGPWDNHVVRYAYGDFGNQAADPLFMARIANESVRRGLFFVADRDSDEATGADPRGTRWDNGADPVAELRHAMRVRGVGMKSFGMGNLREGQPVSNLALVFGPLYYFHRYNIDGTAKMLGGIYTDYSVSGDGTTVQRSVPADRQRAALDALLDCLQPEFLEVPNAISQLLGVRANGAQATAEDFPSRIGFGFDTVAAATAAADLVLMRVLNPARVSRIVELDVRSPQAFGYQDLATALLDRLVRMPEGSPMRREISWAVQNLLAVRLMDLVADPSLASGVRARARQSLSLMRNMEAELAKRDTTGQAADLHQAITRFLTQPVAEWRRPALPTALPGAPIGG